MGKNKHLLRRYNLTEDDIINWLDWIDYRCEICGEDFDDAGGHNVDHCHETGRKRGLLCSKCNIGLGMLGDSITSLRRALFYLEFANDYPYLEDARPFGYVCPPPSGISSQPRRT